MAICPFATYKPIPEANKVRISPRAFIHHRPVDADGNTSLYEEFKNRTDGVFTHFFIDAFGNIEQYCDTDYEAPAQFDANSFAISCETHDGRASHPEWGYTPGYNPSQLVAIEKLEDWCCTVHPAIPRKLIESATGSGIGWHDQFPSWNKSTHDCPGALTIAQITSIIIPALQVHPQVKGDIVQALAVTSNGYGWLCSEDYRWHVPDPAKYDALKFLGIKDMGWLKPADDWLVTHLMVNPSVV